jgi:hypothetical protein
MGSGVATPDHAAAVIDIWDGPTAATPAANAANLPQDATDVLRILLREVDAERLAAVDVTISTLGFMVTTAYTAHVQSWGWGTSAISSTPIVAAGDQDGML